MQACFLMLSLLFAAPDSIAAAAVPVLPERGLCAHRGASETHPENTLSAFREAARVGAHMIEFDVALTKDKQLVLMHDATVDRTTDGTGKVAALTLAEIKALDAGEWKSAAFKGERVPTLAEALDVMPKNVWLNIHVKGGPEASTLSARAVADAGRLHQAFLACEPDAGAAARQAVPSILICNMGRQGGTRAYVDETIKVNANFIQMAGPLPAEMPEFVKLLKDHAIHVNYFSVEDPVPVRAFFTAGVEFPLVNDPAAMMPIARDFGILPVEHE